MKSSALRLGLGLALVLCFAHSSGVMRADDDLPDGAEALVRKALADIPQQGKLTASDPAANNEQFGWSVAVSGNTLVIGVPWADVVIGGVQYPDRGALYVFTKPAGGTWASATQQAKLTITDYTGGGETLGHDVAIDGDTIVAVAPGASVFRTWNRAAAGAAFVFTKPAGGWVNTSQQAAKLSASDAEGQPNPDQFGDSIEISGDTVVVGAPGANGAASDSGAAYVFTKPAGGWFSELNETVKLTVPDTQRSVTASRLRVTRLSLVG